MAVPSRRLAPLVLGALLPGRALCFFGFWDSPAATTPATTPAPVVATARVYQPARPFRVGQDTLGFDNPSGVIRVKGMSGNCYAMAATAKLFYEAARFQAEVEAPAVAGLSRAEVATALRAPGYPARSFTVRGYRNLAEATRWQGPGDAEAWMDHATRYRVGLRPDPPRGPAPANVDTLLDVYRLVTTTHYLHYVQSQLGSLIGSVVRAGGRDALARNQAGVLAELKRNLPRGDLGVLCMFNPDPAVVFGHVVLAYKVVEEPGSPTSDIYIYEDNVVYGPEADETILRLDRSTGRFEYWTHPRGGDPVRHGDGNPYGYSFWDPSKMMLLNLPDLNDDPRLRAALALKLETSAEATAYLQASGDLLRDLTARSPQEAPMRDAFRDYVLALQRSHEALGSRPAWRTTDLPAGAGAEQLNQYLESYSNRTIREILPHVLPEGLDLTDTRMRFHPTDPNRAEVSTTLQLTKDTAIDDVVRRIEGSLLFAGDPRIATLVRNLFDVFEGETVTVRVRVSLEKKETPAALRAKLGDFMPVPNLEGSHTVIGSIRPGVHDTTASDHRIEIAERIMARGLDAALRAQGAFARQSLRYRVGRASHTSSLRLTAAGLDCRPGALRLTASVSGFLGYNPFFDDMGSSYSSPSPLTMDLGVTKGRGKNVFRVAASAVGTVSFADTVTSWIVDLVIAAANQLLSGLLPQLQAAAGTMVSTQLTRYVALANGTSVRFGTPVVRAAGGTVLLALPVNPFDVDVGATITTLFGARAPMEVKDVQFQGDRVVLLTSNDG